MMPNSDDLSEKLYLIAAKKEADFTSEDLALATDLISKGADVNYQDEHQSTILLLSTLNSNDRLTNILIKSGANPDIANNDHISPVNLFPDHFERAKILPLIQEAILENDITSVHNLLKFNRIFKQEAIELAETHNPEMVENIRALSFLTKIKITQRELNNLLLIACDQEEAIFKDMLQEHNYNPDLSNLKIDVRDMSGMDRKCDLSDLNLSYSTIHGITSEEISFANSNLTGANLSFNSNEKKIDFTRAQLINTAISGMLIKEADFEDTAMLRTIIYGSSQDPDKLTSTQEVMDLVITPEDSFVQKNLITQHNILLDNEGMCKGLCIELARHALSSKEKGKEYGNYIKKLNKKLNNPSMNFIYRVQSYHETTLENNISLDITKIKDNHFLQSLPKSIADSDVIGCLVPAGEGSHIFTILNIRDRNRNIIGYKIFDPNKGEISCSTEEDINIEVNKIFQHYQASTTNIDNFFQVVDLEKLVRDNGLIHPNDIELTSDDKKAKKYSIMSPAENLAMILVRKTSSAEEMDDAKTKLTNIIAQNLVDKKTAVSLLKLAIDGEHSVLIDILEDNKGLIYSETPELVKELRDISLGLKQSKLDYDLASAINADDGFAAERISLLISKGANIDTVDKYGATSLLWATTTNNQEKVNNLLKSGANPNIASSAGYYPRDYNPDFFSDTAIMKLLQEAIKDSDIKAIHNLLKHHEHLKYQKLEDSEKTLLSYAKTHNPAIVPSLERLNFSSNVVQDIFKEGELLKLKKMTYLKSITPKTLKKEFDCPRLATSVADSAKLWGGMKSKSRT